ncbi:MarR family transcriptional regulator [Cereibacter sphaeroides]|nr:MarR family transcriptional regulator [Cereibacter sphaeroides]
MPIAPADMLCFSLYSAQHAMQAAYKPLLDPLGLTYPQYLVLSALWVQDDQTVGALGAQLALETNTLTPLLKRMEAAGLVARRRDKVDERQVRVTLAPEGEALRQKAAHVPACFLEATGMSLPEVMALRDQVKALRDHLKLKASS